MPENFRDTPLKLAQCPRCDGYVFLAESSGIRAAADVVAASRDDYVATLVAGRRTFDLLEASGRPYKLLGRRIGSPAPSFDPAGRQTAAEGVRRVLVEHGCGAEAKSMAVVGVADEGPPSARATRGGRSGGPRPATAPGSAPTGSLPAGPVSPHRSEPYAKCGICSRYIKRGESFWGIQHGSVWKYAEHEDCP